MTSNLTKLRCLERELAYRRRVYPRWVRTGRMSFPQADHELKTMGEIIDDYRAKIEDEQPNFFARRDQPAAADRAAEEDRTGGAG